MKITIDSIAKATRKLALENKETSKQLNEDDDWLSLFADDEEPETPEKDEPKDEEPEEEEPKAEDEPEDKPSLDALKDVSIKADDDEELELGTASDEDQDLDDEDTVLDLGSGKEDEPADEPEAEEPEAEEPAGDELEVVDEPVDDEDDEDMEPDPDELEDDEEDDEDDEDDEIELETTEGEGEDLFKDGPADALKSVGIDDPEKADPEDLAAAKALLGTDGEEENKVDEGEDGLHTFILHIRDKQTHKFDHVAIKAADKDEAIRKFWEDPLYNNPDKAPSVFSVDCKDCGKDPILSVEDDEQKQSHTYAAYFDTSVPADVFAEGYSITTDQGDEYAVSVLSQVTENEAGDFPLENVTKDGEDWYDEFNEIMNNLMAEDRVYDYDYDDSDIEWIGMEDDDDEDDDEEADESYDVTDDEDDEDAPPGTGRNPNKAWGYSSMKDRRRDHSDKHGAAKGPRDRKFKPRREFELTNESDVHEVKGAAQIYKFLKECNTYKHSKTLRESVAKFVNIARKSPKKVKQIAEALDKRFTGKTVSEKSFAAAFVGMVK